MKPLSRIALGVAISLCALPVLAKDLTFANWLPTKAQVEVMEKKIVMPKGADPLSRYDRYYTGRYGANGHRIIVGSYSPGGAAATFHIVTRDKMSSGYDGGCAFIDTEYDLDLSKFLGAYCSGTLPEPPGSKPQQHG